MPHSVPLLHDIRLPKAATTKKSFFKKKKQTAIPEDEKFQRLAYRLDILLAQLSNPGNSQLDALIDNFTALRDAIKALEYIKDPQATHQRIKEAHLISNLVLTALYAQKIHKKLMARAQNNDEKIPEKALADLEKAVQKIQASISTLNDATQARKDIKTLAANIAGLTQEMRAFTQAITVGGQPGDLAKRKLQELQGNTNKVSGALTQGLLTLSELMLNRESWREESLEQAKLAFEQAVVELSALLLQPDKPKILARLKDVKARLQDLSLYLISLNNATASAASKNKVKVDLISPTSMESLSQWQKELDRVIALPLGSQDFLQQVNAVVSVITGVNPKPQAEKKAVLPKKISLGKKPSEFEITQEVELTTVKPNVVVLAPRTAEEGERVKRQTLAADIYATYEQGKDKLTSTSVDSTATATKIGVDAFANFKVTPGFKFDDLYNQLNAIREAYYDTQGIPFEHDGKRGRIFFNEFTFSSVHAVLRMADYAEGALFIAEMSDFKNETERLALVSKIQNLYQQYAYEIYSRGDYTSLEAMENAVKETFENFMVELEYEVYPYTIPTGLPLEKRLTREQLKKLWDKDAAGIIPPTLKANKTLQKLATLPIFDGNQEDALYDMQIEGRSAFANLHLAVVTRKQLRGNITTVVMQERNGKVYADISEPQLLPPSQSGDFNHQPAIDIIKRNHGPWATKVYDDPTIREILEVTPSASSLRVKGLANVKIQEQWEKTGTEAPVCISQNVSSAFPIDKDIKEQEVREREGCHNVATLLKLRLDETVYASHETFGRFLTGTIPVVCNIRGLVTGNKFERMMVGGGNYGDERLWDDESQLLADKAFAVNPENSPEVRQALAPRQIGNNIYQPVLYATNHAISSRQKFTGLIEDTANSSMLINHQVWLLKNLRNSPSFLSYLQGLNPTLTQENLSHIFDPIINQLESLHDGSINFEKVFGPFKKHIYDPLSRKSNKDATEEGLMNLFIGVQGAVYLKQLLSPNYSKKVDKQSNKIISLLTAAKNTLNDSGLSENRERSTTFYQHQDDSQLSDSDEESIALEDNARLLRAVYEGMMVSGMKGYPVTHCKSTMDREPTVWEYMKMMRLYASESGGKLLAPDAKQAQRKGFYTALEQKLKLGAPQRGAEETAGVGGLKTREVKHTVLNKIRDKYATEATKEKLASDMRKGGHSIKKFIARVRRGNAQLKRSVVVDTRPDAPNISKAPSQQSLLTTVKLPSSSSLVEPSASKTTEPQLLATHHELSLQFTSHDRATQLKEIKQILALMQNEIDQLSSATVDKKIRDAADNALTKFDLSVLQAESELNETGFTQNLASALFYATLVRVNGVLNRQSTPDNSVKGFITAIQSLAGNWRNAFKPGDKDFSISLGQLAESLKKVAAELEHRSPAEHKHLQAELRAAASLIEHHTKSWDPSVALNTVTKLFKAVEGLVRSPIRAPEISLPSQDIELNISKATAKQLIQAEFKHNLGFYLYASHIIERLVGDEITLINVRDLGLRSERYQAGNADLVEVSQGFLALQLIQEIARYQNVCQAMAVSVDNGTYFGALPKHMGVDQDDPLSQHMQRINQLLHVLRPEVSANVLITDNTRERVHSLMDASNNTQQLVILPFCTLNEVVSYLEPDMGSIPLINSPALCTALVAGSNMDLSKCQNLKDILITTTDKLYRDHQINNTSLQIQVLNDILSIAFISITNVLKQIRSNNYGQIHVGAMAQGFLNYSQSLVKIISNAHILYLLNQSLPAASRATMLSFTKLFIPGELAKMSSVIEPSQMKAALLPEFAKLLPESNTAAATQIASQEWLVRCAQLIPSQQQQNTMLASSAVMAH